MSSTKETVATILIIEDDKDLLELESYHLEKEGYKVIPLLNTTKVEATLKTQDIDLMLVDRVLPTIDGAEFVSYLRDKGVVTPVMFISAKNKDSDVEEGYRSGGDDYLRKPFNFNELLFRVKAILKRTSAIEVDRVMARDIMMDFNSRKTYIGDREVGLTKLEFELLALFIQNKERVLDRDVILKKIWKDQVDTQKRTVNVTINRLKKKIDPDESKRYIVPIRGIGYKFN